MAVTWTRAKPREGKARNPECWVNAPVVGKKAKPPQKLPQDYDSISDYLADRYPVGKKPLPTRANVAFANLKRC